MCNCKQMAVTSPQDTLLGHHINCEDNQKQTYYSIKEDGEPAIVIPADEYDGYLADLDLDLLHESVVVTEISMSKNEFNTLPECTG